MCIRLIEVCPQCKETIYTHAVDECLIWNVKNHKVEDRYLSEGTCEEHAERGLNGKAKPRSKIVTKKKNNKTAWERYYQDELEKEKKMERETDEDVEEKKKGKKKEK